MGRQPSNGRELYRQLGDAARHHGPGQRHGRALGVPRQANRSDQQQNLGAVPQHRRDIGEEEAAVAVEDAEAPCRQHQEAEPDGGDAGERDGQLVLIAAVLPAGEQPDQRPGQQDAGPYQDRDSGDEQ